MPARAERARLYMNANDFSQARDDLVEAYKLAGADNEIAMQLAYVYERLGDWGNAGTTYANILGRDPSHEPAIRGLANMYFRLGDWTRLEGVLADAHRRFADKPYYYFIEADMWLRRGNRAKALVALEAAFRIAPNDKIVVGRYLVTLVAEKRYDKALEVIDRYINHEDFGPWVKAIRARIHVAQGEPAKAEALFTQAVTEATSDSLTQVGVQLRAAYGINVAIDKLMDMLELRPDDWQVRAVVGGMCAEAGRMDDALRMLTEASQLADDPDDLIDIYTSLGTIYYKTAKFPETEAAYLQAISIETDNALLKVAPLNNLAYMYAENLDQLEKAIDYAGQAVALAPNDPNILDTYGWALAKLKRYDEAVTHLRRSVGVSRQQTTLYHLAYVYEQLGRGGEARRLYQEVKTALGDDTDNPDYKQAQEGLDRLDGAGP